MNKTISKLYRDYHRYRCASIEQRRFGHVELIRLIDNLQNIPNIEVTVPGRSVEGRAIYMVKIGKGPRNVLMWSQMHGDEATATMALLDIFNFFTQKDAFDTLRDALTNAFTLYFIPVLNPDGMVLFQRRNALGIDLNRDALERSSPESTLLKQIRDQLRPEFGFNLHDQDIHYTVGTTDKTATISFLAPPTDPEKSVNQVRLKSAQVISYLYEALQQLIPGQVAKFMDDFEPRAFGENMQIWGTSTILVESGGRRGDPEKQEIRKLNFALILAALEAIATNEFQKFDFSHYEKIPVNGKFLFDLLLRNVKYRKNGKDYLMDIGINRQEVETFDQQMFYCHGKIADIGDLSNYYGYEELVAAPLEFAPGKVYPQVFQNVDELTAGKVFSMLKDGYSHVATTEYSEKAFVLLPINANVGARDKDIKFAIEENANFFLKDNRGAYLYAVINGFLVDLGAGENFRGNGLIIN